MKKLNKKIPAFNLTELLVVLAIVGILLLLALPNLLPLVTKAKTTEAQTNLKHIYTLQQSYFYVHSEYSEDFESIDFEAPKLVTEGGKANYEYEIVEVTEEGFKATATSVKDFDKDGQFNVWEIDQENNLKEIVKD